ncbi:fatty acid desaturase family protein [Bradyrhizobium sp. WYCCWR 13023]|uniref:Fatty acid desaturase family protein n=1 Tax=Bradyrhizobium zhengyangense TaxID=2911009 RepID=A0A9X1UCF8_9BRAD|nr:fatty acid desaturase family protein [Bradyrhizobium zhengyangense]MCG2632341.1 fatty acid desaturase family protein [Bradyrhizobium zhengyangense]MCG2673370.1 fatty acid desaturase family protein [Bradyrhizobium zhengyangense]
MTEGSRGAAPSATQDDACVREIPRFLTKEEMRSLSEVSSGKVLSAFAAEMGMVGAAIWLSEATWFNPLTYLLALFVIGSRIVGIGGLMHEAAHYRVAKNRLLNDIVGEIMAFPTTASMAGYRNTHFAHHRELNSERDPDWTRNFGVDDYEFPVPQYLFLRRVALHFAGLKTRQFLGSFHNNPQTRQIPVWTSRLRLLAFGLLFVSAVAFGFWKELLLYWLVPLLTTFMGVIYLKRVSEHYGVRHESVLNETRTIVGPWWQILAFAPWGLNYHLEHHLYPGITCFNLGKAHRLLMKNPVYAENANVTRGYWGLVKELAAAKAGERDKAEAAHRLLRSRLGAMDIAGEAGLREGAGAAHTG